MKEWWRNLNKTDVRNLLAVITLLGAISMMFVLLFYPIPVRNQELVYLAMGIYLGQQLGGVNSYFFGGNKKDPDDHK